MCTYCVPSLTTQVQCLTLPVAVPPAALLFINDSSINFAQGQILKFDVCQDDGWPDVVRCVATLSGTVLSMRVEARAVHSLLVSSLML